MNLSVYRQIRADQELLYFLRQHPIWYRKLSRNQNSFEVFQREANIFHGKTVPQRIEKVKNQIQMIDMIISISKAMKD